MSDVTEPLFRRSPLGRRGYIIAAVIVAAVVAYTAYNRFGRTHVSTVDPAQLATQIDATDCTDSGYRIKPNGQGWIEVYNCNMTDGRFICVGDTNSLASNITLAVKAAFSTTLGGQKPDCAG